MPSLGLSLGLTFRRSAAAAPAYYPATLFAGGKKGQLFDGIESALLQATGGAAAGNGDVIGDTEDVSGNLKSWTQTTGAQKPTNTVTNGINAITLGSTLRVANADCGVASGPYSIVVVCFNPSGITSFKPWLSNTSQYHYWLVESSTAEFRLGNALKTSHAFTGNTARILRVRHFGEGANELQTMMYDLAGAQVGTTQTSTSNYPAFTDTIIGSTYAPDTKAGEVSFSMLIGDDITGTAWDNLLADLVSRFGAWK